MTRPISILIFFQIKTDPNQTMLYGRRVLEEVVHFIKNQSKP